MKKKNKTYDEIFKYRIKQFFEKFAIVKTEYEILRLPRKADILVIEAEESIQDHVLLFTYFKKYNIIEFKSEEDRFRTRDLYKIATVFY
ncbi:MAG: hypothetical protein KDK90_14580 [Leptospiraceae bacterium]|nr:hypothetical protein [Leptospiraceae bacterium]